MGTRHQPITTKQTVKQHLQEIRNRFFVCIAIFIIFGVMIFFFYEPIISLLGHSLGSKMYYTTPAGGFSFVMRICTSGAIIFTIPIIIFNIIQFIRPAFPNILTTKRIIIISVFSSALALTGGAFAYFLILPESLNFFSGFNISGLDALIGADDYLNFVISMITAFAIIFQVPLLILLVDSIKKISPKILLKNEIWIVLISVVVAIITPFNYDVLSSLIVAIPIIGLYNLSIAIISLRHFILRSTQKHVQTAVIVKPSMTKDLSLTSYELADIKEAIKTLNTPTSIKPAIAVKKPIDINFSVNKSKDKNITQPQWSREKQLRLSQIQTSRKAKVFSDILPRQSNRVLASQ